MSWKISKPSAVGLCMFGLLIGGCDNEMNPPQEGENLLAPRQWMQIQSDEQGTGFNGVHTSFATPGTRKWQANIGELAFSSPVVDNDGDVWVGNVNGELVEVGANGQVKTRQFVGGTIVSSPAVDDHYRVYVLSQYPNDGDFRTILHCYDPALGFIALNNPPQYRSTASPKVWRDYVFVPSDRTLRVFDRWTLALFTESVGCPSIVCGSFDPPLWVELLGYAVGCLGTLYTTDLLGLIDCHGFSISQVGGLAIEPSVAIVDNANIVDDPNKPIVIMATPQCLTAFNFDPTAVNKLQIRWQQELVDIDCDFEFLQVTTPAVLNGELVVVGTDYGQVRCFHVDDGTNLWNYGISEPIRTPPVAALRHIYFQTTNYLVVLDSNGREASKTVVKGTGGGVSLSLDFVYAMTSEGIYSGNLNGDGELLLRTFDDGVLDGQHLGNTVPAIDREGNVFLAGPNGTLTAYGRGQTTIAARIAAVSWIAPDDGASVYTSTGQSMHVALNADGGFTGNVTISSDVDGILCEFDAMDATEGSCLTTGPLTLGPHVLTAFATDPEGVQESAQINVQVIAAPIQ